MAKFRLLCGLRTGFGGRRRRVQIDEDQVVRAQNIQEESSQTSSLGSSKEKASNKLFQYLPLDRSVESNFRLLTLLPGPEGSQPRCKLSVHTWQEGHASYETLSYVWGDSKARKPIILDGKTFQVTENLFSALSHLRFQDRPRVLWIDAICIDQDSIKERNHQVASMGDIYGKCEEVVIWLGDEDNETESVVDFIKSTFEEIKETVTENRQYRNTTDIIQLYLFRLEEHMIERLFRPELQKGWTNFAHILGRPWWTRAWIVQEFSNAPKATFHIGEFEVDWTLISALIIVLFNSVAITQRSGFLSSANYRKVNDAHYLIHTRLDKQEKLTATFRTSKLSTSRIGYSFMVMLRGQTARSCIDPRDKVYSVLSMADASISKVLLPDYSKPARWTHIAAVRAYISVSKKLDILGCSTGLQDKSYPSWCPDWNARHGQILAPDPAKKLYNTTGTTEADAVFSKDESTLYLKGFLIGRVVDNCFQSSTEPFDCEEIDGTSGEWNLKLMAQKLQRLKSVHDASSSKDDLVYSASESELEEYFNTVAATLVAGFWYEYVPFPPVKVETDEWWTEGRKARFIFEAAQRTSRRTVVLCQDGKLGLAHEQTENGDEIWIFMGAITPFVLRKTDEVDGDKAVRQFIGSAYVHGVMKGEAMEDLEKGKYEVEVVSIR
jgi:Heterokaryon incompatibility protein (HET)